MIHTPTTTGIAQPLVNIPDLEQRIMEAAANNDDTLMDLLQEAIDTIPDEAYLDRLLDRVSQVQIEDSRELRNWREP